MGLVTQLLAHCWSQYRAMPRTAGVVVWFYPGTSCRKVWIDQPMTNQFTGVFLIEGIDSFGRLQGFEKFKLQGFEKG